MAGGGFREPGHLPNLRDGSPASAERLPRQRRGVTPQLHGRYPDYDVLAETDHWDEVTRGVVLDRVENVPPIRFFTAEEVPVLRRFCDAVMAQDRDPRIPVLEMVDDKLHAGRLDGFRFHDMPEDPQTWRIVARGLREAGLLDADDERCEEIVEAFSNGELSGGAWEEVDVSKAWSVVMRGVLQAFYSHPWAWNEIGFGGPAYPRGYARFGLGQREHWEGAAAQEAEVDAVRDVEEQGLP